MNRWRYIVRSLSHHFRIHVSVALGVAAATAVLTGALLVGDSVRGSLRHLTLDRLGRIDQVLVSQHFFDARLARQWDSNSAVKREFSGANPAILLPTATAEAQLGEERRRASRVTIIGCGEWFWDASDSEARPQTPPGLGQVVLNQPLADELGVTRGDQVILRLPKSNQVPADSLLGQKTDRIHSLAGLEVTEIIAPEGLGRFSLQPQQTNPWNAYVAMETLQSALDQSGRANAIFVFGQHPDRGASVNARLALADGLTPDLEDYGLSLERVRREFEADTESPQVIYDYIALTTDRMLFDPIIERTVLRAWKEWSPQSVFTYLAKNIEQDGSDRPGIPYSLVTAVDSNGSLGPLLDDAGQPISPLNDNEIVLNRWAADDLQVAVGDSIRLTYFPPETTHSTAELETDTADFTIRAVVPLTEPVTPYRRNREAHYDKRPALANDPDLTPVVKGVTDQDSISRWEAPFPVDNSLLRPQDDEYWANHRTTPKAFVSLATGQRLWGSRFGRVTSFRLAIPANAKSDDRVFAKWKGTLRMQLREELSLVRHQAGFTCLPVKAQGLQAATGATDFDGLFLALSFFVIAAGLMLVALLFRLGVERRADELGILFAVGFRYRSVALLLSLEALVVAAAGSLVGVGLGVGYAALMIYGLQTRWVGAITTPFLRLYIDSQTLILGFVCGLLVSMLTIVLSVRRARRIPVRELLAGRATEDAGIRVRRSQWTWLLALGLIATAVALTVFAMQLGGMAQAGAFVGAGFLVLIALLAIVRAMLRSGGRSRSGGGVLGLAGLAVRSATRNPGRSTMTIGLMATASFLIVAMSAFRMAPSDEGTGGFDLMAESSMPIFVDLNTPEGRDDVLADQAAVLDGGTVMGMRLKAGEDASCQNLYQTAQPAVLGVPDEFIHAFDNPDATAFAWSASTAVSEADRDNPWRLLAGPAVAMDEPVPVVLDASMATYSLHLKGVGDEYVIDYPSGKSVRFRVVGLLAGSVLQGRLLVGEQDFVRQFPEVSGYRFFLIQSPPGKTEAVVRALEERLSDQGFDAIGTYQRLEELQAVQNTYLSTFQSLGALGLLLGTFGLATVQLRNVIERRSELALLRAVGFRPFRLARMVLLENFALLLGGILTGALAAMVAVLPHAVFGGASIPGWDLLTMLGLVLVVGVVSSLLPVRATLKAPVVSALRGN